MIRNLLTLACMCLLGCSGAKDVRHFFVKVDDGYHVKVVLEGNLDGEAILLLLHGGPVGGSFVYNSGTAAADLETTYAVAYLDQRAQGASQGNYDIASYGIQTAAEDVNKVLDVLAARFPEKKLFLYGHSWGGMLGTATLVDTPAQDKLSGWIEAAGCHDSLLEPRYVEAQIRSVAAEEIAQDNFVEQWQSALSWLDEFDETAESFEERDLVTLNQLGYDLEAYISQVTYEQNWPAEDSTLPFRVPSRWMMNLALQGAGIDTLYTEATKASFTDRLDEIAIPGLYAYAKYDFVCPPALGIDAANANTSGQTTVELFDLSGHSLMGNEPTKYVDVFREFIDNSP